MKKLYTSIRAYTLLLLTFFIFKANNIKAQDLLDCGSDRIHQSDFIKKQIAKRVQGARVAALDPNQVITLPVVFIVHHLGEAIGTGLNVSNADLMTALTNLNNAYAATDYYIGGINTKIKFALVKSDKACNPTTGIIRINSSSIPGYSLPKGVEIDDYEMQDSLINQNTTFTSDDCIIIRTAKIQSYSGFASFYGQAFIRHDYITSKYTVPHELGHIFTLYHTFEGDAEVKPTTSPRTYVCPPNADPNNDGDQISDTAPHTRERSCSTANIATTPNVCDGNAVYGNSLKNIMSYSSGNCMDRFTPGQIARMREQISLFLPDWINSKLLVDVTNPPLISITPNPINRGSSTTLSTNCIGTVKWYNSSNVLLATQATYTASPLTNTIYKADCRTTSCTSPKRTDTVEVSQPIIISNNSDQTSLNFGTTDTNSKSIYSTDNQRIITSVKLLTSITSALQINAKTTIDPNVDSTSSGRKYLQRHYDIVPSALESTLQAEITLYYSQAEFNAYNSANSGYKDLPTNGIDNEGIDNIRIFQAHGTALSSDNSPENYSGTTEELTPTSIVWNAAAARWEITIRVTGFSGFFVMTPQAGSLPLTLASFKGYANAQSNELTWATVSEQNFSHFEIQRTEDGKNWETIEKMEAINITTSVKNYSYNDKNPLLGNTYYRLKMIDINGSVSLSKAINIDNALIYGIKLFPNPTKEKLKINFASSVGEKIEVMLLDAKGKVISIENFKTQSKDFAHEINLKSLNVGIYFMKISDRKRQITQKIVKQ